MRTRLQLCLALVFVWLLFRAPVARADDAEDAQAMFAAGVAAFEIGETVAARAAFERSLELFPTSAAAFNLAGILKNLDRPTAARALYDELLRGVYGPLGDEQQAEVTRLQAAAEAASARIEVTVVAEQPVAVTIGEQEGTAVEGTALVLTVDPGQHTVRGTSPGARPVEREIEVRAGGVGRTLLRFERPPTVQQPPPVMDITPPDDNPEQAPRRISGWWWVALGVVVAGGAAAAIVLTTRSDRADPILPAIGTLRSF